VLSVGDGQQVSDLEFTPNGRLPAARNGELLIWDVEDSEYRVLVEGNGALRVTHFDLGPHGTP
jgi:hypothetical protein